MIALLEDLEKYKIKGIFNFKVDSILKDTCNIPPDNHLSGLYLFYDKNSGELLYIGISGRTSPEGTIIHRKDGMRGRFLKGKKFGDWRRKTLPAQMLLEGIDELEIRWFGTFSAMDADLPRELEVKLLTKFNEENQRLPLWNKVI